MGQVYTKEERESIERVKYLIGVFPERWCYSLPIPTPVERDTPPPIKHNPIPIEGHH
jgi:hypothetical protein